MLLSSYSTLMQANVHCLQISQLFYLDLLLGSPVGAFQRNHSIRPDWIENQGLEFKQSRDSLNSCGYSISESAVDENQCLAATVTNFRCQSQISADNHTFEFD